MTEHTRKLAVAGLIVAFATAISRFTGLGREVVTAAVYGVGADFNTLVSVSVIPTFIQQLFADAAISAAFVPVFTSLWAEGDRERAFRLAANLLGLIVVVVGGLVVLLMLAAGPLAATVFPELTATPEGATLATNLLRLLLPTILFLSFAGALSGVLYSLERFTVPSLVSVVWNITIIAAVLLLHGSLGVYAAALGMLVGTLLQWALLAGAMGRAERWLWPRFGLRDPLLARVLLLMVPITLTLGVLNFNALIGTWFAQFVSERAAAEIGYAFRLYQLPQGVFAVTIGTVLFPTLSRLALTRESGRFAEAISFGVRQMVVVSLPFVAWFVVMPEAFVRLLYERGRFGPQATAEVSQALAFMAIGLLFANSNIMLNRAFQSMQRPWRPFVVSLLNMAATVVLCWLFYRPFGVAGITLSMGLVSVINFAALYVLLHRELGGMGGRRILGTAGRTLVCTIGLGLASWLVWRALAGFAAGGFMPLLVATVAAVGAGALVYVGLIRLLRVDEFTEIMRALLRRRAAKASE